MYLLHFENAHWIIFSNSVVQFWLKIQSQLSTVTETLWQVRLKSVLFAVRISNSPLLPFNSCFNIVTCWMVSSSRGATTSSKLMVQFLGRGYYYSSTEKLDMSTQFDGIGYIITLFIKKLRVNLGVRPNFGCPHPSAPKWLRPCPADVILCTL